MPRTKPNHDQPTASQRWAENNRQNARNLETARRGPEGMARAMSQIMVDLSASQGQCTADDLARAGFTAEDIQRFGPAAKRLAGRSAPQLRSTVA